MPIIGQGKVESPERTDVNVSSKILGVVQQGRSGGLRHIDGACNLTSLWKPSLATCVSFAINQWTTNSTLFYFQLIQRPQDLYSALGHLRSGYSDVVRINRLKHVVTPALHFRKSAICSIYLALWRLMTPIGVVPHHQPLKLHFIYLLNKYRYWIF